MTKTQAPASVVPEWRKPVVRVPLTQAFPQFDQIKEFRNRVCLFSEDRTKLYDVVSPRYQLVEHGAAIDAVEQALVKYFGKGKAPTFNVRTLNNGARLRAEVKLPLDPVRLGKQDVNELTLLMRNSYDRSAPFNATLGAFRLICSNGMKVGTTFGEITARHVGGENADLLSDGNDTILDQLDRIITRAPLVRELWSGWAETRVDLDEATEKLDGWLPAKYAQPILEASRWTKPRSMWDFYNDLTHMSTHLTQSLNRRMEFDDRIASIFYADEITTLDEA